MNKLNKETRIAFGVLILESICFSGFLLSIEVNGLTNAFSTKYIFDILTLGSLILIPLTILYRGFFHKRFLINLLLTGFAVAALLQPGAGEFSNHLLWFFIRYAFTMIVLAGSVTIATAVSKIVSLPSMK
ncbi:MAG: hypothetical protein WDN75_06510 [Bacteroidota bacterium]